jgi:hypothetical protein
VALNNKNKEEYNIPQASIRGIVLCDSVADTIYSPVKKVDVTPWVDGGETMSAEGGDVYISL